MRLSGGPTKDEILAISLFKMGLKPGDHFMDIGCGTGKVSIHAATKVKKVSALDIREEAITLGKKAAEDAGITNIEFFHGSASELIPLLPRPDCVFIGGSRELSVVLPLLARRNVRTIVLNAVKLDTIHAAITLMKDLGIFREAINVQVSHAGRLGKDYMWRPANPVTIIVGSASGC